MNFLSWIFYDFLYIPMDYLNDIIDYEFPWWTCFPLDLLGWSQLMAKILLGIDFTSLWSTKVAGKDVFLIAVVYLWRECTMFLKNCNHLFLNAFPCRLRIMKVWSTLMKYCGSLMHLWLLVEILVWRFQLKKYSWLRKWWYTSEISLESLLLLKF